MVRLRPVKLADVGQGRACPSKVRDDRPGIGTDASRDSPWASTSSGRRLSTARPVNRGHPVRRMLRKAGAHSAARHRWRAAASDGTAQILQPHEALLHCLHKAKAMINPLIRINCISWHGLGASCASIPNPALSPDTPSRNASRAIHMSPLPAAVSASAPRISRRRDRQNRKSEAVYVGRSATRLVLEEKNTDAIFANWWEHFRHGQKTN